MKKAVVFALFVLIVCALFSCAPQNGDAITSYNINAVFNAADNTLSAVQTVEYVNDSDAQLDSVMFHLYPSAFRDGARFKPVSKDEESVAYPNGVSYGGIEIKSVQVGATAAVFEIEGQDENILAVSVGKLMPHESVRIKMDYVVSIPNVKHRFGYNDKTVNLGNFYPIACVYENGVFHTDPYYNVGDPFYSRVANYTVVLNVAGDYKVAHTGELKSKRSVESASEYVFKASKVRDFALTLSKDFSVLNGSEGGVDVSYYYYSDDEAQKSLDFALLALKTFNAAFGKYPYASLRVAQTGFLHGGMEYPQLVFISDAAKDGAYRDIIVHEIAHQWWYAVVGNNQTKDAWLDEALAEYSTTLFYKLNPDLGVDAEKRVADSFSAFILFCDLYNNKKSSNTPMNLPLGHYNGTLQYTACVYTKGQIMFDTLHKLVGDSVFYASLRRYYKDNKFKVATADHLIAAFEHNYKTNLASFFSNWTDGNVILMAK